MVEYPPVDGPVIFSRPKGQRDPIIVALTPFPFPHGFVFAEANSDQIRTKAIPYEVIDQWILAGLGHYAEGFVQDVELFT